MYKQASTHILILNLVKTEIAKIAKFSTADLR